jgi:uncharacterized protein (TIGR00645 family)
MSLFRKINKAIEDSIEYSVFASRWFQAIIYVGLIIGAALYSYKFIGELVTMGINLNVYSEVEMMLGVLGLIDISMVMNLLVIVIIGGYSIFTSRLDFEGKEDKPQWLDNLDADRLKVKLSTSLASISGVHLLKTFIDVHSEVKTGSMEALNYEIAIHLVFIVSSLCLAWIVIILKKKMHGTFTEKIEKKSMRDFGAIIDLARSGKTGARSHIKNLIQIAAADGKFEGDEKKLLATIAKINNIPLRQVMEIKEDASQVVFELPADPLERFAQFYGLVQMMAADQRIHPSEMRLCELFAIKFGYRKDTVRELIDAIRANMETGYGPEETYVNVESFLS